MRKIALCTVLAVLIMSFTACGTSTESTKQDSDGTKAGVSSSGDTESNEADTNLVTSEEAEAVGNYLDNLNLEIWDGSVADSYAGGSGTKSDPYQISNGAELALLSQDVDNRQNEDCYYILTADILLNDVSDWENWVDSPPDNVFIGIGDDSGFQGKHFQGIFDGQNHTIYGYYSTTGLFVTLEEGGTIQNVCMDASVVNGQEVSAVGGFVDEIKANSNYDYYNVTIENCLFNGIVTGANYAGGIVGDADTGAGIVIKYCKNSGTVSSNGDAGGIVGCLNIDTKGSGSKITHCDNYGTVTGTSDVGGIVGSAGVSTLADGSLEIYGCRNTGPVSNTAGWAEGGIAGCFDVGAGVYGYVTYCVNSSAKGIIDEFYVGADGNLILNGCYYKSGSSAYDTYMKSSSVYGSFSEYNLNALDEDEFRLYSCPLYSDAEEALDTGDYVKYNGKIYYRGYSGNLYMANYDATQERTIDTIHINYFSYENYLVFINADDEVIVYDMDTGDSEMAAYNADLLGIVDEKIYYQYNYDYNTTINVLSLDNGATEEIELTGIEEADYSSCYMVDSYFVAYSFSGGDDTWQNVYNFYTLDGELFHQLSGENIDENMHISILSGTLLIYGDGTVGIYDPLTEQITENYTFEGVEMYYYSSVDENYIYAVSVDGDKYIISRTDGSCKAY